MSRSPNTEVFLSSHVNTQQTGFTFHSIEATGDQRRSENPCDQCIRFPEGGHIHAVRSLRGIHRHAKSRALPSHLTLQFTMEENLEWLHGITDEQR